MALFLLLVLFIQTLVLNAELVQVIQLARHGARTPNSFNVMPDLYKEGNGELTSLGHVQQYFLGQEMRKRYIEETNFLSATFNASEIVIKSSYKNRTQRSAYAFTSGLYPQEEGVWLENEYGKEFPVEKLLPLKNRKREVEKEEIHRIKIHEEWAKSLIEVIAIEEDYHFHAHENDVCPPAEKLLKERKSSKDVQDIDDFFKQHLYEHLIHGVNSFVGHSLLDGQSFNLKRAKSILDNHRCNSFHGVPHTPFEEKIIKLLYQVRYNWAYKLMQYDKMLRSLQASKLLSEFLHYTNSAKEKTPGAPKYVFYSAHDSNLENLFSVFLFEHIIEANDHYNIIPFSSVLSIEVHKENIKREGSDEEEELHYVKLFFNDEPQLIKWCKGYECTLERFHKILTSHMVPELEEFCSIGKKPKQQDPCAGVESCVIDEVDMKASEKLGKVKIED